MSVRSSSARPRAHTDGEETPMTSIIHKLALATIVAMNATGQPARGQTANQDQLQQKDTSLMAQQSYVGMCVTGDGHTRQELLTNGRYDEARGHRKSVYQGRYEIHGNRIYYWDDAGFMADGTFIDGVLQHAGMLFYREKAPSRS